MNFSKRTEWPKASNRLTLLAEEMRKAGQPFIDLTESNPTLCSFKVLNFDLLKPLANLANLVYEPDPLGSPAARLAVCRYYADKKIKVRPEQVILTSSTSEAYAFLFRLLLDPGEKIAVPAPSYPLLDSLSRLSDAQMVRYRYFYEERWRVDLKSLKEGSKAVCVVNPNNPTGNFIREEEKKGFNKFCAAGRAAIISDEVFLDYPFQKQSVKPSSFAGNEETLTFVLSGLSKVLALPQMKVSWIVASGPEDLLAEALRRLEIIADTYLSVNTPAQAALEVWLQKIPEVNREISDRTISNYEFLKKNLAECRELQVLDSEGGWVAVVRVDSPMDDEEFSFKLLETAGVLVHPGYLYDFEEGKHLILSLLLPPGPFKEAVLRMSRLT